MISNISKQFIRHLQEAERSGIVDPLVGLFTDDAELLDPCSDEPLCGNEEVRRFWLEYLRGFRQVRTRFTNILEGAGMVVLEWFLEGISASGRALKCRGVTVMETAKEQVHRLRIYFDPSSFYSPIGKNKAA